MTHDDVRALIETMRPPDDERTADAMYAAKYGRNLTDLTAEKAIAVMYEADRAAAGTSAPSADGRYNRALLTRTPVRVETQHAMQLAAAFRAGEEGRR